MASSSSSNSQTRSHFRRLRNALSGAIQRAHAERVRDHFLTTRLVDQAACTATYLPIGGELDPQPLMQALFERGCRLCLPVIGVDTQMTFHHFEPGDQLQPNRYGIPEPVSKAAPVEQISLMLVPLVAFDHSGTRLGMGAGYYDRFLADLQARPLLIGLAHAVQQTRQTLQREVWDIPLNAVITETGTQWFD